MAHRARARIGFAAAALLAGGVAAIAGVVTGLLLSGGSAMATPRRPAPDACLGCHYSVTGLGHGHDPAIIGCSACHGGRPRATTAAQAHKGLVRVPGNLADLPLTCATAECHAQEGRRLRSSLMTTMAGVVAVDRWVFGEASRPGGATPVTALGHSKADSHLRNLCASCHLGNPKADWGPIGEASRGGGCLACHLVYSQGAVAALASYRAAPTAGFRATAHPSLSSQVDDTHCFGCHARSGRISLNYEGWREASAEGLPPASTPKRTLEDGRVVYAAPADVHAEAGMGCADCHTLREVMGDGVRHEHEEQQSVVRCDDCHRRAVAAGGLGGVGVASRETPQGGVPIELRGNERFSKLLAVADGREALRHTRVRDGAAFVVPAGSERELPIRPQAAACARGRAHENVTCAACHDAWAPTCIGCHTTYDPGSRMVDLLSNREARGEWRETGGDVLAEPASLGVRVGPGGKRRVQEFVPGMILTIDRGPREAKTFRRLFAPIFPHTIRRQARSCAGCHSDPVALGYGRGKLDLRVDGTAARWTFAPARPRLEADGLPEDAWLGFLGARGTEATTREDARPFTPGEQRRLLTVGACLSCHAGASAVMRAAEEDFAASLARRSNQCAVPTF